MTETVERIKAQVGTLTVTERADLAYFLLNSLEPATEDGVEEAWRDEIARRVAQVREGQAKGRSAEDVLAELRERHP